MEDLWQPHNYGAFKNERAQPFFDLLTYVTPCPNMRIVDLGCGSGELTLAAHRRFHAADTIGIDSSAAMLGVAPPQAPENFHLRRADIADFTARPGSFDLLLSNAALHWLPDHPRLLTRLATLVSARGQVAVQVPANEIHPSQQIANAVAAEEPFARALNGYQRRTPVLRPEAYRRLMSALRFSQVRCEYRTYRHQLACSAAVVDWVRSTLLTDFEKRMSPESFAGFLARYRERLLAEIGDVSPYQLTYRRLFLWGAS